MKYFLIILSLLIQSPIAKADFAAGFLMGTVVAEDSGSKEIIEVKTNQPPCLIGLSSSKGEYQINAIFIAHIERTEIRSKGRCAENKWFCSPTSVEGTRVVLVNKERFLTFDKIDLVKEKLKSCTLANK